MDWEFFFKAVIFTLGPKQVATFPENLQAGGLTVCYSMRQDFVNPNFVQELSAQHLCCSTSTGVMVCIFRAGSEGQLGVEQILLKLVSFKKNHHVRTRREDQISSILRGKLSPAATLAVTLV